MYDIITIGSAVRDVMFATSEAETFKNPHRDPNKVNLIGFEYGAKIHSEEVHRYYGGGANNTAVGLARLGLKVAACVCVGNDPDGLATVAHLKAEGVHTKFVQHTKKQATGFSFLVVETKTYEHVALVDYGANEELAVPKTVLQAKPKWFYVSSLSTKRWPSIMRTVLNSSAKVAWNPGAIQLAKPKLLKPLLKKVTVLILNRDEATELVGKGDTAANLARQLQVFGPKITVVTDGRHGAAVYDGKHIFTTKGSLAAPKDTTGAGDCFGSSFVAGLIRFAKGDQLDFDQALKLATINASSEVSKAGAQNGLLTWAKIKHHFKA